MSIRQFNLTTKNTNNIREEIRIEVNNNSSNGSTLSIIVQTGESKLSVQLNNDQSLELTSFLKDTVKAKKYKALWFTGGTSTISAINKTYLFMITPPSASYGTTTFELVVMLITEIEINKNAPKNYVERKTFPSLDEAKQYVDQIYYLTE